VDYVPFNLPLDLLLIDVEYIRYPVKSLIVPVPGNLDRINSKAEVEV